MKPVPFLVGAVLLLGGTLGAAPTIPGFSAAGVEAAVESRQAEDYPVDYLTYGGSLYEWDGVSSRYLGHLEGNFSMVTRGSGSPFLSVSSWHETILVDTRAGGDATRLLPPAKGLVDKPQSVVSAVVNAPGTLALVRLGWSNSDESWSKPYLATVPGWQLVRALHDEGDYWFSGDGKRLIWSRPDYDPQTGESKGTKQTYLSATGQELAGTVKVDDQSDQGPQVLGYEDLRDRQRERRVALPDFEWNEFGLKALWPEWTSGNLHYRVDPWLAGRSGGPDPVRDPSRKGGHLPPATSSISFREEGRTKTLTLKDAAGQVLWTKKFLNTVGVETSWISEPTNRVWLGLNRPRPTTDGTWSEAGPVLRELNLTTGLPVAPDRKIPWPTRLWAYDQDPADGWIAFTFHSLPILYWPALDRWSSTDGTSIVGKGVEDKIVSGPNRGVTRTVGSQTTVLPPAPGQVGIIVRLARDPSATWFLAIDEAGTLFARRSKDGAVLYQKPIDQVTADDWPAAAAAVGSAPSVAVRTPQPWFNVKEITLGVAPGFSTATGRR